MAQFASYSAFGTSLCGWLDVNEADVQSRKAELIMMGENRIFREARTRDMEESYSTAIGSGVIAVPSGWVEWKHLYVNTTPVQRLETRPATWIYERYPTRGSSGKPKYIAREGTNFIFGPYPDSGYTVTGVYYKRLDAISASGLNALFTNNEDLYLLACLAEAEMLIGRDNRVQLWEAKYQKILSDVNGEDRRADASGSVLRMRA